MNKVDFSPFPILFSERLILRQLKQMDDKEIYSLRSNKYVSKYIDRPQTATIEDAKNFIDKINNGIENNEWIYWAVTTKDSDKLIGTICIWNFSEDNEIAELGFELFPQLQGKGIMQETLIQIIKYGFENINLKKLEAYTNKQNIPSIKLLEKYNFILEKTIQEKHSISGESLSTVIYSLER